jgi:hypothetical protein
VVAVGEWPASLGLQQHVADLDRDGVVSAGEFQQVLGVVAFGGRGLMSVEAAAA